MLKISGYKTELFVLGCCLIVVFCSLFLKPTFTLAQNKAVIVQATVTNSEVIPPQTDSAQASDSVSPQNLQKIETRKSNYETSVLEENKENMKTTSSSFNKEYVSLPKKVLVSGSNVDDVKYRLGPNDVIRITVQRHPEFSGDYPINMEGKIQIPFLGDMDINGLTKKEVEEKLRKAVSRYVVSPDLAVTILEYRSKFYFVIGEVAAPGKYYMRSETTTVRDAVVEAGLPLTSAAMRKCRLITPSGDGKVKTQTVDLFSILYGGNLKKNLEMRPGDVLYVPSTMMTKIYRVIAPVAAPIGSAAGVSTGLEELNTRPSPTTPRRVSR